MLKKQKWLAKRKRSTLSIMLELRNEPREIEVRLISSAVLASTPPRLASSIPPNCQTHPHPEFEHPHTKFKMKIKGQIKPLSHMRYQSQTIPGVLDPQQLALADHQLELWVQVVFLINGPPHEEQVM